MEFSKINSIDPTCVASWEDRIFLTFDFDWACDELIHDTADLLEKNSVPATFFVTHATPVLQRLRENPLFELGIHPNFNESLLGEGQGGSVSARVIMQNIMQIVPDARSVRSHSVTQSSKLMTLFCEFGLEFDCNHLILHDSGIVLKPWRCWSGLVRVPYFWEDYFFAMRDFSLPAAHFLKLPGIRVFNFHPVHVGLNSRDLDLYEQTRSIHHDAKQLKQRAFSGYGVKNFLLDLISEVKNHGKR